MSAPARMMLACLALAVLRLGAATSPVLIQSAAGRFEIAAVDPTVAHAVATAAEEGWRLLSAPLALPDRFTSPVYVRILGREDASLDQVPFAVRVEVGGSVSVRVRADVAVTKAARRALVQALLMRLAVSQHGVTAQLTAPLWLEHACVGWWETRAEAAQLDALKQASAGQPPPIEALLGWQRGGGEPRDYAIGAVWLLAFLQSESGRGGEWPACLSRLLNGLDPLIAVTSSFPARYGSAAERELWWQTGYHHLRRQRTLPALEAPESRAQLAALTRFVFAGTQADEDIVVPLAVVLERRGEPVVEAELVRRAQELARLVPALHPFYRNAGLSLGEAIAARQLSASRRAAALATFEQDWRDALELEHATRTALDALEQAARAR